MTEFLRHFWILLYQATNGVFEMSGSEALTEEITLHVCMI